MKPKTSGPEANDASARLMHVNINIDALRDITNKGIRRAAAFLSIGLTATDGYVPTSLNLRESRYKFFAEPLSKALAEEALAEFRPWLVGSALRELDLFFSLFLDETWRVTQFAKLHGTRVPTARTISHISDDTNAAKKFEKVLRDSGDAHPDASMLRSLSNARNCLTHSVGVVTSRHAKSDGVLVIRWIGLDARLVQGENNILIPHVFEPFQAPDPSQEADVIIVVTEREKRFGIGETIKLLPTELHEICLFYQRLTNQVIERLTAFLATRGVAPPQALTNEVPAPG